MGQHIKETGTQEHSKIQKARAKFELVGLYGLPNPSETLGTKLRMERKVYRNLSLKPNTLSSQQPRTERL
jgi:hypothetical protein